MILYHNNKDLAVEVKNGVRRLWMGDNCQGQTSNTQPLSPVSDYMKSLVPMIGKPNSVLFIGLGAGILPSKYAKMGSSVTVVEPREDVLAIATKYFKFPTKKATVILGYAEDWVIRLGMFDRIVIDAHDGFEHPPKVYNDEFYSECLKHLNEGGQLLINLIEGGTNKIISKGNEVPNENI